MPLPQVSATPRLSEELQPAEALGEAVSTLTPRSPTVSASVPWPPVGNTFNEEDVIADEEEQEEQEIEVAGDATTPQAERSSSIDPESLLGLTRALDQCSEPPVPMVVEANGEGGYPHRANSYMSRSKTVQTVWKAPCDALGATSLAAACEGDLKIAEHVAKTRGLPPDLEPDSVREFLLRYGYDAVDHQSWGKMPDQQPELRIQLANHIEFGDHTHYELVCKVLPSSESKVSVKSWRTLRRLKHIRLGLHDPVKKALGPQYAPHFGATPFAHHTAPVGTTARLRAWFGAVANCINAAIFEPSLVAITLRLLDGPGTPLIAPGLLSNDFEDIPITAAIFGSKQTIAPQGAPAISLPRVALGGSQAKLQSSKARCLEMQFDAEGCERKVQISRRPLGAEFRMQSAGVIKVSKVKLEGHAAELGFEVGWTIKFVGGEDASTMSFQQVQDAMKIKMLHLPLVA
jgi:hypothetical protein